MKKRKEILKVENVKKVYLKGKFQALRGISLTIYEGEYVAIMGRSGSGKSTFLHIMGCLDKPDEGKVYVDGIDTDTLSEEELAEIRRKKIGFVFQSFNLIPNLTALENVMLPMMFAGVEKEERKKRAMMLLKKVGLEKKINNLPSELSGGERQRVAIARALANEPSIILADEPTGNLDSKSGDLVLKIFKKLNEEGKTIVVVTHERYVSDKAKRITHIKDGLIYDGKIEGK